MTDAALALQTLGVNAETLAAVRDEVARATVPVTARSSDENPTVIETVQIDGPTVLDALTQAAVELNGAVRGLLGAAAAEVTFSAAPGPVLRFRPMPERLISADTPEGQPCPANLG